MLKVMLQPHIRFAFLFLILGAFFGLLYALNLLGIGINLLQPDDLARSLHISLMLYGFIPLMMTLLPFLLFEKEGVLQKSSLVNISRFLWLWYIFLIFMIISISKDVTRGLPFYDFSYELNAILVIAGLFYIVAFIQNVRAYVVKPLWLKVSLFLVAISPIALLVLMNPQYGQVEKSLQGPHGDNTLGMSFALVAIYYLVIKLRSQYVSFQTKWHILWIIPLIGYILSVIYRISLGTLSYNAEWFLQYLTLFYIPLLYRWIKDAKLNFSKDYLLYISISAFLFADIEGNILFIPYLRHLFHRNDLVVGHAHIAVGIGLLFMALSIIQEYISIKKLLAYFLAFMLLGIGSVLTISGIEQARFATLHTKTLWELRASFGALFLFGLLVQLFWFYKDFFKTIKTFDKVRVYNLVGFTSDGLGGLVLILFGKIVYYFVNQSFTAGYQEVVFAFVTSIGAIHLLGVIYPKYGNIVALATVLVRIIVSAIFFALYKNGTLGTLALAISAVDFLFVLVYLMWIKDDLLQ